MRKKPGIKKT